MRLRKVIHFTAHGIARPAGSKHAMPIRKGDRKTGEIVGHTMVDSSGAKGASWRSVVKDSARAVYTGPVLLGAIDMRIVIYKPRPKNHYTKKGTGPLMRDAPRFPTSQPDTLKLARAIEDAIKGVIYKDDAQIVRQRHEKVWVDQWEPARADVTLIPLE